MTKQTNQLSLIDIENDFTEEEESMFATKKTIKKNLQPGLSESNVTVPQMPTMEESIVAKYQAGMPVTRLMRQYGMSTTIMYKILNKYGVPLRGARNQYTNPDAGSASTTTTAVVVAPVTKIVEEGVEVSRTIVINIPKSAESITLTLNMEGEHN